MSSIFCPENFKDGYDKAVEYVATRLYESYLKERDNIIVSESQKKARNKWDGKHMVTVGCKLKREQAELFRKYAADQGKTVNEILKDYVMNCIEKLVE